MKQIPDQEVIEEEDDEEFSPAKEPSLASKRQQQVGQRGNLLASPVQKSQSSNMVLPKRVILDSFNSVSDGSQRS